MAGIISSLDVMGKLEFLIGTTLLNDVKTIL